MEGKEICKTLGNCGLQLKEAARMGPQAMGERIMDCAWTEALTRLEIDPKSTEFKSLPDEIYWAIPLAWPSHSETHTDLPNWNAAITGNILETYATCTFLKANQKTRATLRSILWAAILAEPRAARALAMHCIARGREEDIPNHFLAYQAPTWINLGSDPFPPSEEEIEESPQDLRRENKGRRKRVDPQARRKETP